MGVGWLIWICQRPWGSFFWSLVSLMAQQFLSTDGSFYSSCCILQGHNLCWTGKGPAGSWSLRQKTLCMWLSAISLQISSSISSLFLSCGLKCWCGFVWHISACRLWFTGISQSTTTTTTEEEKLQRFVLRLCSPPDELLKNGEEEKRKLRGKANHRRLCGKP